MLKFEANDYMFIQCNVYIFNVGTFIFRDHLYYLKIRRPHAPIHYLARVVYINANAVKSIVTQTQDARRQVIYTYT